MIKELVVLAGLTAQGSEVPPDLDICRPSDVLAVSNAMLADGDLIGACQARLLSVVKCGADQDRMELLNGIERMMSDQEVRQCQEAAKESIGIVP